jgi:hypothetical protein
MKRLLTAALLALSSIAFGATLTPIQLLSPAGSTSGQVIASTGTSTAPAWTTVTLSGLGGLAKANNLSDLVSVSAARTNLGLTSAATTAIGTSGATIPLLSTANTWTLGQAFTVRPTFNGATPWDSANLPSVAGRLLSVQVFSSGGTYTPTSGTNKVIVEVQASGGGGGGVSATGAGQAALAQSGGAGAFARALVTSGFSGVTITMPAGGTAGTAGANAGATAGAASFGSIVSCPGGIGGNGSAAQTPPFLQSGAASTSACTIAGASTILSVVGRAGFGQVVVSSTAAIPAIGGFAATAAGSGGNGAAIAASTGAAAGSVGITGYIVVYEYN